jgi:hypothetical protein
MATRYWEVPSEDEQAIEITVGDARVAWTENDDVYLFTGPGANARDDGYTHIGTLKWEESMDEYVPFTVEEAHNLERLREFFLSWRSKQ